MKFRITILFACTLFLMTAEAQDTLKSLAYKDKRPPRRNIMFYQPDLAYQLWQRLTLQKEAKEGDPFAQHELGLRYLLGQGIPADTISAAEWIKKAADKNLTAAQYNFGILLVNGWGVEWNPFEAFKYFRQAAIDGMPEAQYITGLFYTDNLVVRRDWAESYRWIKRSAGKNYEPAKDVLARLEDKVPPSLLDTAKIKTTESEKSRKETETPGTFNSSIGLVFIDFESLTDSSQQITDEMLLTDLTNSSYDSPDSLMLIKTDKLEKIDFKMISYLRNLAETGSPEALTLLGRLYEKGIYFRKNLISAAAFYFRAIRLDSPKANVLLWNLKDSVKLNELVQVKADSNDPEALFTWYGLTLLGYENRIAAEDAVNLLQKSAETMYIPAIVELGLIYFTGQVISQDKEKSLELWRKAADLSNEEAAVRIAAGEIFSEIKTGDMYKTFEYLKEAAEKGSVLAETAVGFAYENGIAVNTDKGQAVNYFKRAAQRGSRFAFRELKRLYDEIRPDEEEFTVH